MQQRNLGKLSVSALGFGVMGMTQSYPPFPPKEEGIATIRKAFDLGVNFFDTSEAYGPYTNEELLGEAVEPFRKAVVLATKFGWDIPADGHAYTDKAFGLAAPPPSVKRWKAR